ncbi:MAG: TIGR00341 family protein [Cyanophyceae cyanobacterium]
MKQNLFPRLAEFWNSHSGDWHWLIENPRPIASINRHLWRLSVPSFSFYFLQTLSAIIATLGLLADSVAIIIGAMIIAPLMGPIIGIAYSMVVANRRLLRRSILTLLKGVILTVVTAFLTATLIGLRAPNSEILARANPTLIDLGVALAAGAAGAFANSRRSIAEALPGVAIAVALAPPLSVVGIGLSIGEERLYLGALLLFATNLVGIIFSGGLVFLLHRYGNVERAKKGLLISVVALCLLGLPLGFSLNKILVKENVRRHVGELIRYQSATFSRTEIMGVSVEPQGQTISVELEVAAPLDSISDEDIKKARDFLVKELDKSISLKVQVFPVKTLEVPSAP